ncbi:hypothetical protein ACHAWF_013423 [Thalassiosira exigua]
MRASSLFVLPCIAAASPLATLRGGSADMVAAKSLATLSGINGAYMAFSPYEAGERLYQISKEDVTPTVKRLIRNNGMSALSLATTSSLLAYLDVVPSMAIAAGLIPRLIVLIYSAVGEPVRMKLDGLVPGYIIQIACAVGLATKSKRIDPAVAMKIMSFFYISAGVGVSISPQKVSKHLLQLNDATKVEQRCLRAQGKTDLINGVLCWALAVGRDLPRAQGL